MFQAPNSSVCIPTPPCLRCFFFRFCTLQCRESAATGGESVLVSGAELLAALSNEELRSLMQPGSSDEFGQRLTCCVFICFYVDHIHGIIFDNMCNIQIIKYEYVYIILYLHGIISYYIYVTPYMKD